MVVKFTEEQLVEAIQDMQGVYDLSPNDPTAMIITDSVRRAFGIQVGSGSDTDNVFEIRDTAGALVGFIQGNGNLTLQSDTGDTILKLAADLSNDNLADTPFFIWEKSGGDQCLVGFTGLFGRGPDGTIITGIDANDFVFHLKILEDFAWAIGTNAYMRLSENQNGFLNVLGDDPFDAGFQIRFGDQDFVMLHEDVDDSLCIIADVGRICAVTDDGFLITRFDTDPRTPEEFFHVRGSAKFEGQTYTPVTTLTDAPNISIDHNDSDMFQVTLAGNRTLDNPVNAQPGSKKYLRVVQDVTGSRTLAFDTAYQFENGTPPILTIGIGGAVDLIEMVVWSPIEIHVRLVSTNIS